MFDKEEIKYWFAEAKQDMVSLLLLSVLVLIRVALGLAVIVTLFVLLVGLASKSTTLDPVKDINNILYWFVSVPLMISIPYYFLLRYICSGVKYIGMVKDEREIQWNVFRYLLVFPITLILISKIILMVFSPSSEPLWFEYIPIAEKKLAYYQPIWAEHVNSGYVWLQSHLTFLPPLEQLL